MKKNLILALVILLGGLVFIWCKKAEAPSGGQTLCALEALMCPDGTSVSRTGPHCAFTTCPNGSSYEGVLVERDGDFSLTMGAPLKTSEEVAYSMPLKFKTTSTLKPLVGKRVVVTGVFITGNILEVKALEEVRNQENVVSLQMGETGFVGGVRITLNKLISDSRCSEDVVCITAGFASFEVILKSDTDQETVVMRTDEKLRAFDSFSVSIAGVETLPRIAEPLEKREYRVSFRVDPL